MHRVLFAALALFALSTPAFADGPWEREQTGFYFSGHGGAQWLEDGDGSIPRDGDESKTEYDVGYRGGLAFGYDFTENFGAEIEASHAKVSLDHLTLKNVVANNPCPAPCTIFSLPAQGYAHVTTFMANVFAGVNFEGFRPYIGAGGGIAVIGSETEVVGFGPFNVGPFEDNDTAWAAQGLAGIDYAITDWISFGGRYRLQVIGSHTISDGAVIKVDTSYWHSAEVVLKVRIP